MEPKEIVERYRGGESAHRLAYLNNCSVQHIYDQLKKEGEPRRPGSGNKKWKVSMGLFFKKR